MIHPKLINPQSIVVIGGSDNLTSPGGRIVNNLTQNNFKGKIYIVNPKKIKIGTLPVFQNIEELPQNIDLAILAISAKYIEETIKTLTEEKNIKAFIIISAGFSDAGKEGKELEQRIVNQIEKFNGSLLGPNNIGLINTHYAGVFTTPVPELDPSGVDLISGSGATAVFIIEAAMKQGLKFNSVWTVGNSAQIGVEEILEYLDKDFNSKSPKIKLLYIETIKNPLKFFRHTHSLIKKGAKIVAIKAGSSQSGQRAASSHTGSLATSDIVVQALFDKAGIIRVYGRNEMIQTAIVLHYRIPKGKNILVVTHAGGPGVMLTDILEKNGMKVPELNSEIKNTLRQYLYPGSSVDNPIDFLATGTAQQLDRILNFAEQMEEIDGISVIFGSPGLFEVYDAYEVLNKHIENKKKIIYPVLPSLINVKKEIEYFHKLGNPSFSDEVLLGKALSNVYTSIENYIPKNISLPKIKTTNNPAHFLSNPEVENLLFKNDFPLVKQQNFTDKENAWNYAKDLLPVVLKSEGIIHKSDKNAVRLNIRNKSDFYKNFNELQKISPIKSVLIQQQIDGLELFIGVKYQENFGHLLMFGLGGIFVEIFKDIQTVLSPVHPKEIENKLKKLKSFPIFQGVRGKTPININMFIELIQKTDNFIQKHPEIMELDFNPVKAVDNKFTIVDARILSK